MSDIILDWIPTKQKGVIKGEYVNDIREMLSVPDETARFRRYSNRFVSARKYVITPAGRYDPGLTSEILKVAQSNFPNATIKVTDALAKVVKPTFNDTTIAPLDLELRDYQQTAVESCLKMGRGVISLATAGGKTLIIASLIESIYKTDKSLNAIVIVPDLGLVNQTYNDFSEYGVSFSFTKWTGNNKPVIGSNIIIANLGILQSKNTDIDFLEYYDMVIVDEVHKLRRGNKINKLLSKIKTSHKFGFTGTLPEEQVDKWNIMGKVGPILLTKTSRALADEDYISKAKIIILNTSYNEQPTAPFDRHEVAAEYRREVDFIIHSEFRNNLIGNICKSLDKNILIIVDYIEHGLILEEKLNKHTPSKSIHFIQGEVDVEERDKVKQLMEEKNNVICVAISKIFSTGINIKNLHYIMFANGGKAKIKIIQSIGRGLRLHTDKDEVIIFDIADNLKYGMQHMKKRMRLYTKEQFNYGVKEITERSSQKSSCQEDSSQEDSQEEAQKEEAK